MRRMIHPLQAIALALLLVLTGQSMALMRTAPDPAGQMVLCTGTGPITVLTDENGQPVGAPHICPDCAMSLFAAVPAAPEMPPRPAMRSEAAVVRAPVSTRQAAYVVPSARDPPALS
ncbi:MAG: hypothetical protein FH759_08955 [Sediminimonas qiaohouensis]|uniref:DUF2946 domain-containing protein n=2 Tax=Roseobacteraceae TaxID=2854170 RepID=A0A7C9HN45_9RHOB|nr:hypothetical protein [Sediminimonas qiaohouensis]